MARPGPPRAPSALWGVALPVATALLVLAAVGEALATLWYLPPWEASAAAATVRRGLLLGGACLGLGALLTAAARGLGPGRYLVSALLAGLGAAGVLGAGLGAGSLGAIVPGASGVGAVPSLGLGLLVLGGVSGVAALAPLGRGARLLTLALGAVLGAGVLAGWRETPWPLLLGTLGGLCALLGLAFGAAGREARALHGLLAGAALAGALVPAASAALAEQGLPGLCGPCALGLAVAVLAMGAAGGRAPLPVRQ